HPPTKISDFLELGLLHDVDTSGWNTWLKELDGIAMADADTATLEGPTFEDFNLLRAAVLSGQGVALCPKAMIQPDLDSGSLVEVSQQVLDERANYYLLSTNALSPLTSRQAQAFRDWAMSERTNLSNSQT